MPLSRLILTACSTHDDVFTDWRAVRSWKSLDISALSMYLRDSKLLQSPPDDVDELLECYNTTLRSLTDKHVPLRMQRVTRQSKARWFDTECREMKRKTRKLERQYRRLRTEDAETAWRDQFQRQRRLYEDKFTSYWCETVDKYRNDARGLWRMIYCQAATECSTAVVNRQAVSRRVRGFLS